MILERRLISNQISALEQHQLSGWLAWPRAPSQGKQLPIALTLLCHSYWGASRVPAVCMPTRCPGQVILHYWRPSSGANACRTASAAS